MNVSFLQADLSASMTLARANDADQTTNLLDVVEEIPAVCTVQGANEGCQLRLQAIHAALQRQLHSQHVLKYVFRPRLLIFPNLVC